MNATQQGVIALLKSAITGEKLSLPEGFNLKDVSELVVQQGLAPLAYQGAYNCGVMPGSETMNQLQSLYYRNMICSARQLSAVKKICAAFEENGIDYILLKGCVMKELYPQPELRPMGDADILIRLEQYPKIRLIMQQLGFEEKNKSDHELVWKSKDLYLELHKYLFPHLEREFYAYFGDGWNMTAKQVGHRFYFRAEDEFVFLFTHMTKHYRRSGIGGRHILDLYVYRNAYPNLDEAYIEHAMDQIHLLEFYRNIRKLLSVWFEKGESDKKTDFISGYILSGGSWGDLETKFLTEQAWASEQMGQEGNSKVSILFGLIFPSQERLQSRYFMLRNYPYLYPVFCARRWIEFLIRPTSLIQRLKVLDGITDEKVTARRSALQYVGLYDSK